MESFILEPIDPKSGYLLYGNQVSILLFLNDIVLLSHSVEGLQCLIDVLYALSARHELVVNLNKTKVVAFNVSKATLDHIQFTFRDSICDVPFVL